MVKAISGPSAVLLEGHGHSGHSRCAAHDGCVRVSVSVRVAGILKQVVAKPRYPACRFTLALCKFEGQGHMSSSRSQEETTSATAGMTDRGAARTGNN